MREWHTNDVSVMTRVRGPLKIKGDKLETGNEKKTASATRVGRKDVSAATNNA